MAGQLQPATATAGVPACIKMIKHPVLQLPNCSWDFAAVESHHEKYIQCCNSVSVLFRPTNLPCELKRNEVYRPNSSFFSLPGCNPFLLSVTGNFQCSGIEISILHGINLWGLLSNCFPGCEQLEGGKKKRLWTFCSLWIIIFPLSSNVYCAISDKSLNCFVVTLPTYQWWQ